MSSYPNSYIGLVPRDNSQLQCQTSRAPDYYGLGVRLGIYFAWLQAYLANNMIPSEIAGAADTNTMFLLGLLVAMIRCSSIKMLEQIDGLILMHLSGGTIFGIFSIWGYRTRRYIDDGPKAIRFFGGFGTHSRLIVSLAVSIFGLWYWLHAVTGGLVAMGSPEEVGDLAVDPPNSPGCGTLFTFMFAKVRADGGIRIFYILVCICCTIYFGIMLLMSSIAGWARVKKIVDLGKQKRWADTSKPRFATGFTYRELETIFKYLRVLNFLWLVFSVLLVEFTLNFNHVTAVLGGPHDNELHLPSQLLPLLMGAFGFVRACYLLFESWRSPGIEIEPSVAEPSPPHPSRTMHIRDLPLAFSPAMVRNSVAISHDPNELDELERGRHWPVRYLVAWLPWLSLLPFLQDGSVWHQEKRQSDQGGYSRANDQIDFAQPPQREQGIERKPVPEHGDANIPLRHGETV